MLAIWCCKWKGPRGQAMSCHCAVQGVWLRRGKHLTMPTLSLSHQEETHVRKPQTFHDAHSHALPDDVRSGRKPSLFRPSLSWGLALTCSQKWSNLHSEHPSCLRVIKFFPHLGTLCMSLIHDHMDPLSKAAVFFFSVAIFHQASSLSHSQLTGASWVIHVPCFLSRQIFRMYQF